MDYFSYSKIFANGNNICCDKQMKRSIVAKSAKHRRWYLTSAVVVISVVYTRGEKLEKWMINQFEVKTLYVFYPLSFPSDSILDQFS